jgi:hypothetical protein
MKSAGLWSNEVPGWIHSYSGGQAPDIWQWLQYIHLPMRVRGEIQTNDYLAPQLANYINGETAHQEILQLVIELDALSPTLEKPRSK